MVMVAESLTLTLTCSPSRLDPEQPSWKRRQVHAQGPDPRDSETGGASGLRTPAESGAALPPAGPKLHAAVSHLASMNKGNGHA
jgi:hypothetical protein